MLWRRNEHLAGDELILFAIEREVEEYKHLREPRLRSALREL